MTRFVALLRAVNLGGTSTMPMAELRQVLEATGLADVRTYIQSGNVVCTADGTAAEVETVVREAIRAKWDKDVPVLARTGAELDAVIAANPYAAEQDDPTKLHVSFLDKAPTKTATLVPPPGETGVLTVVGREVYLHVPDGYGRSKLQNAFVERRTGTISTTRNWKSVLKLRDMAAT